MFRAIPGGHTPAVGIVLEIDDTGEMLEMASRHVGHDSKKDVTNVYWWLLPIRSLPGEVPDDD